MHDNARGTDEREQEEARRNAVFRHLGDEEGRELGGDVGAELGFPRQAFAEGIGYLGYDQALGPRRQDIEQDLETGCREPRRQGLEVGAADHEEAAHGIADLGPEQDIGEGSGEAAHEGAVLVEAGAGGAAAQVARRDHQAGALLDGRQHPGQDGLVVLQVAIHDRDDGGRRGEHALDAGAGKAAAANAANAADARVGFAKCPHLIDGAVAAIVIDENDFPIHSGERRRQGPNEGNDVSGFPVGRHDDAELRRWPGRGTALGLALRAEDGPGHGWCNLFQ